MYFDALWFIGAIFPLVIWSSFLARLRYAAANQNLRTRVSCDGFHAAVVGVNPSCTCSIPSLVSFRENLHAEPPFVLLCLSLRSISISSSVLPSHCWYTRICTAVSFHACCEHDVRFAKGHTQTRLWGLEEPFLISAKREYLPCMTAVSIILLLLL